jgi:transcriptional regulator with XRE-family HTH domain
MAVAAQFDILPTGNDQRGTGRHQMRLRVRGAPPAADAADVLIHNLSSTGLLLESASQLLVGDEIVVELPEAGTSTAKVVWASGQFFGCAFDQPLSAVALSAAQLRGEPVMALTKGHGAGPAKDELSKIETFGARLHRLRRDRGFTLVEFARRTKVSRPTVWSWEADRSTPRRSKTRILLEVLGVTADELFGTTGAAENTRQDAAMSGQAETLQHAINEAKERVADLAGTSPDKVRLIIEI